MFYDTAANDHGLAYNPFKSCVIPRPIGWVSTVSHDGLVNLAPFSFFNGVGANPMVLVFSPITTRDGIPTARVMAASSTACSEQSPVRW